MSSGQVVVTGNVDTPISDPGADQLLTCDVLEVTLNGSNSTSGNNISYEWQDANGTILGMDAVLNLSLIHI